MRARAPDFDDEARSALIGQVLGVLDMPALAALFGSSVRAEVGLAGTAPLPNGKTREILGQIDRVAESEAEVIVADYKTGTPRRGRCDAGKTISRRWRSIAPCSPPSGRKPRTCECC